MGLWPQFQSAGLGCFRRQTYFTVFLIFWYAGIESPDLATLARFAARTRAKRSCMECGVGMRGSAGLAAAIKMAYLLLAGSGDAARAVGA